MPLLPNRAHDIPFALISSLDGLPLTGASVTGYRVIDGGTQQPVSGTIVEKGSGQYLFEGVTADFTATKNVGLLFTATGAIPAHVLILIEKFYRDTAQSIPFLMLNASLGSALTGGSLSGYRIIDGGAQAAVSGTFVERGNGQYVFQGAVADFAGSEVVGLLFTATGGVPVHLVIDLVRVFAQTTTLADSPASVLRTYAVNLGHGSLPSSGIAWPLYVGTIPDGIAVEDDAATFIDTAPVKDGRHMAGDIVQHYGVELLVRATDRGDGWTKASAIASAFDAVAQVTTTSGGIDYLLENISRGGVNFIGLEPGTSKRRYLHTVNFLLTMRQI